MAQVILNKVGKKYSSNSQNTLSDIDVTIEDKEFMVLLGPSGCGKSTLLRMIAGLEDITSGQISIDGQVVNNLQAKDRNIAMVFQNYALFPHLNVYDNIAFGLRIRKTSQKEIEKKVSYAASILGLEELLRKYPRQLSGGQCQRVALGRAIVRDPKVFLFDEPLSNLDAKLRVQMRAEINRIHKRLQTTMIYVTHDQVEAMTMADRILVLHDGIIQQIDTPLGIYDNPANIFVASFLGSPPMNMIKGKFHKEGEECFLTQGDLKIPLPPVQAPIEQNITLGIRPENVHIKDSNHRYSLPAQIDIIETMGADVYVYGIMNSQTIIVRVPSRMKYTPGNTISLSLDQEKTYVFDEIGKRIV